VTEYKRPTADQPTPTAAALRTIEALHATLSHLITNVLGVHGLTLETFQFCFDRLRAVRKDVVYQELAGPRVRTLLLGCFRFSVLAGVVLARHDGFEAHHNLMAQKEILQTLGTHGRAGSPHCPVAATFRVVDALYYLGNPRSGASLCALVTPAGSTGADEVVWARDVVRAHSDGNYHRLFELMRSAPSWLHEAVLHRHLPATRARALAVMVSAYATKVAKFPLLDLARILGVADTRAAATLCKHHKLEVDDAGTTVFFRKGGFQLPDVPWDGDGSFGGVALSLVLLGGAPADLAQLLSVSLP
jgi:hypothetical protein